MRKIVSIILLVVANTLLLAHSVVHHHHHGNSVSICLHSHNTDCNNEHHTDGAHKQENHEDCSLLDTVLNKLQNNISPSPEFVVTSDCINCFHCALKGTIYQYKPFIESGYTTTYSTQDLRAPPFLS